MLGHLIFIATFCIYSTFSFTIVKPGPQHPPTKGEAWPKPQQETKEVTYFKLQPSSFTVTEKGHTCDLLKTAIDRYKNVIVSTNVISHIISWDNAKDVDENDSNYKGILQELQINLSSPCESYPYLDMDEKYSLYVSQVSTLNSNSIWGVLRGLETFVQLFYMSEGYKAVLINATQIVDFPKYKHRGLLIDTSRHFISVKNILKTLDAMEMNKMNVLHWHIVDDQSFPYQSEVFPQLSKAAYDPTMVYKLKDINQIVNYAKVRGIRVIPEFDVPGHTSSWGVAYPDILTKCYRFGQEVGLGPMDPTKNLTYQVINDLFHEVQQRFPDKYLHVGGDEVEMGCWASNQDLRQFMAAHNITHVSELHSYFMSNVIPLLGERSKPIVWQEVFDEGVPLPKGTIVQVWKNTDAFEMFNILSAGYKVIYSSSWYLDHIKSGGDWEKYYSDDPRDKLSRENMNSSLNLDNVLGGEACMWDEVVDDTNIISRVWPRASAVAEILWSGGPPQMSYIFNMTPEEVRCRLEEHACRMNRRHIDAQPPNGPGFCLTGHV